MLELMKKTMLTGIGLALKTTDELKDMVSELSEKGKLSEDEGREFLDDLISKCDEARSEFEERVEDSVRSVTKKMDLASRKEVNELKEEVKALRELLERSEKGAE